MLALARIAAVLLLAAGAALAHAQVIGRVLVATGDVTLVRRAQASPAPAGTTLEAGDTVRTGAASNAQLWLSDGSIVALRQATEFAIAAFRYTGNDAQDVAFLELVRGGLRTIAGLVGASHRAAYRLRTTNAILGRRGTEYAVLTCQDDCTSADGTRGENGTYGAIYDGRIGVANNTGEVEFGPGDYFYVASLDSAPRPLLAPPGFLADRLAGLGRPRTSSSSSGAPEGASGGSNGSPSSGDAGASSASASASTTSSPSASTTTDTSASGTASVALTGSSLSTATTGTTAATTTVGTFTSTSTVSSSGAPAVVTGGTSPPLPTVPSGSYYGIAIASLSPIFGGSGLEVSGGAAFSPPASLSLNGETGALQALRDLTVGNSQSLHLPSQPIEDGTTYLAVSTQPADMLGYEPEADIHWGRWADGLNYDSRNYARTPPYDVPPTGIHYVYGNTTADTVIAAKTGTITYADIGGTVATDSTGATACSCSGIGPIDVNFTTRTGTISSVNYVFPTATYNYSNLPFQVFVQSGVGAWLGADLPGSGTCSGSGCGSSVASARFNGHFFGATGNFLGLAFQGSTGTHGFAVVRVSRGP